MEGELLVAMVKPAKDRVAATAANEHDRHLCNSIRTIRSLRCRAAD